MSRGLGRIEKRVIEELKKREDKEWNFLENLLYGSFDGLADENGNWIKEATNAQYMSVYRAVKTLEKKGFVESKKVRFTVFGRGGATVAMKVKLVKS